MSYVLKFSELALKDLKKHKKSGDKGVLKKIEILLNELILHPKTGTGSPEALKHDYEGYYSRRINKKHRLIYAIKTDVVEVHVLSAYGHYKDK